MTWVSSHFLACPLPSPPRRPLSREMHPVRCLVATRSLLVVFNAMKCATRSWRRRPLVQSNKADGSNLSFSRAESSASLRFARCFAEEHK